MFVTNMFTPCKHAMGVGRRHFSNIGFIGLGNMGSHMATNLLKKGYKLTVFDINKLAVSNLVEAGADGVNSVAETSENADVVISMLPSNKHVLDCYSGVGGILSSVKKNALLIDSSTVDPSVSTRIGSEVGAKGAKFIDAPVSGGVNGARDGTLTFMVGGSEENFALAKPLLEVMGSKVVRCGEIGTGQAVKICNNMLMAISMIGTSETFNLGKKLGVDPKILAEIVNSSSGRCWSSELYNPVPGILEDVPSSNDYQGGFGSALMEKDLGLAQAAATRIHAPIPLGSLAHQVYKSVMAHGLANKDFSVVYQFLKGQS